MICTKQFTMLEARPVGSKGWFKLKVVDDQFSVTEMFHLGDVGVKPGQKFKGTVEVPQDAKCRLNSFEL